MGAVVDRFLAERGLTDGRSALALCGRVAFEGRGMVDRQPLMEPNDAALRLLEEMARDMRETRTAVGTLQQTMARFEGLGLDERLRKLSERCDKLTERFDDRCDKLTERVAAAEKARDLALAQRKPWVFLLGELAKIIGAGGVGAFVAYFIPHHR